MLIAENDIEEDDDVNDEIFEKELK